MLRHCEDQWRPKLVFPHSVCQHHFHPTSAIWTAGFEEFGVTKSNELIQLKANLTFERIKRKNFRLWVWETNDGSLSHSPLPTISFFPVKMIVPSSVPCTETSKHIKFVLDFSCVVVELLIFMKGIHLLYFKVQLFTLFFSSFMQTLRFWCALYMCYWHILRPPIFKSTRERQVVPQKLTITSIQTFQ